MRNKMDISQPESINAPEILATDLFNELDQANNSRHGIIINCRSERLATKLRFQLYRARKALSLSPKADQYQRLKLSVYNESLYIFNPRGYQALYHGFDAPDEPRELTQKDYQNYQLRL